MNADTKGDVDSAKILTDLWQEIGKYYPRNFVDLSLLNCDLLSAAYATKHSKTDNLATAFLMNEIAARFCAAMLQWQRDGNRVIFVERDLTPNPTPVT